MQCLDAAVAALLKKQGQAHQFELHGSFLSPAIGASPHHALTIGPLALCKKQIQICPSLQKAKSDTHTA